MLVRSSAMPTRAGYAFEPKLDGFRDGELIAFADGQPDFVALCDRMLLTKDPSIPIAFVAFDVLSLDGTNTMREPYRKRRELLEDLELGSLYKAGERGWLKVKNKAYWKYANEREAIFERASPAKAASALGNVT